MKESVFPIITEEESRLPFILSQSITLIPNNRQEFAFRVAYKWYVILKAF